VPHPNRNEARPRSGKVMEFARDLAIQLQANAVASL
jgi:hypothetical protein